MFDKYINYIRSTGLVPLRTYVFDEDWAPIGASLRSDLERAGLITVREDGIRLVEAEESDDSDGFIEIAIVAAEIGSALLGGDTSDTQDFSGGGGDFGGGGASGDWE